jgi:RNA polymerase sigma factor (sigma-70 family)
VPPEICTALPDTQGVVSLLPRRTTLADDINREGRFNRLYDEHYEAVRRYVWRREPSLADDVASETFLVAWRRLDAVPASARPWLIGVARKVRLNMRRGARRQLAVVERLVDDSVPPSLGEQSRDGEIVRAALALLGERDREILLLAVWDELDRASIAEVLGCTSANVSLRLHRARRRFAAAVAELRDVSRPPASSSLISGGADVSF